MMSIARLLRAACLVSLLAFCGIAALPAAALGGPTVISEPGYTVSTRVDWAAGAALVEITHALDPSTASAVRAKGDAETDIESRLGDFLPRAVASVTVDSSHTFADLLDADAGLYARVSDLTLGARLDELVLSADFSSLIARYRVSFFGSQGIASPLYPSQASPIPRRLSSVTTRNYTGLLIYAKGMLPEAGTSRTVAARPALFPRLWDEQMNLVLDKGMCAPEALATWGMVGYAQSLDDAAVARAGASPLRVAARGVFGDKATDIVISMDAARQLLSLPQNIAILREGRIVIVYDTLP